MKVTTREYKFIVDSSWFVDPVANLTDILAYILDDTKDSARLLGLGFEGKFVATDPKERTIIFLDTPDFTLRQNGLLLRQRVKQSNGETEYTLKCRTEDRYIATSTDVGEAPGLEGKAKFEEDIGCPFVSRYSRSNTISLKRDHELAGENLPKTLSAAVKLFPGLLNIQRDGLACTPATLLAPVNGRKVYERVFDGPALQFPDAQADATPATIALILWSKGKEGRTLTAEFSFRYEDKEEDFSPQVAIAAKRFFERLQHVDWARSEASTKTQYMYGSA